MVHANGQPMQRKINCSSLDGIYFPDDRARLVGLQIPIVITENCSTPVVEAAIPRYADIPLRKAYLRVSAASHDIHTFVIFFRYHANLADNSSLQSLDRNIRWTGDAVVLKAGKRDEFVHLRGAIEKSFATFAVRW